MAQATDRIYPLESPDRRSKFLIGSRALTSWPVDCCPLTSGSLAIGWDEPDGRAVAKETSGDYAHRVAR